jgi:hypothetical protein
MDARFTLFTGLATQPGIGQAYTSDIVFRFTHCVLNSGRITSFDASLCLTNCLLVGIWIEVDDSGSTSSAIYMQNCTVREGFLKANHFGGSTWPTRIQNCAFDSVDLTNMNDAGCFNSSISYYDYNAFITATNRLPLLGTHDVTNFFTFTWQTNWLGNYYLPPSSSLIDAGYGTADQWGLYHFTTQTNQVKEASSQVDIGYHYVAVDAFGNPIDTNGDGIPDYLEDANGNGIFDGDEIADWLRPIYGSGIMQFSNGFGVNIFEPKPRSYIP